MTKGPTTDGAAAAGRLDEEMDRLLATPELAKALESDQFKQFLDHLPIAILVGEIRPDGERVVYVNIEAVALIGLPEDAIVGATWQELDDRWTTRGDKAGLARSVLESRSVVGAFDGGGEAGAVAVEANAAVIQDDEGRERFRLVALVETPNDDAEAKLREKDLLLNEIQHRVKNNLQMITALIRMEARKAGGAGIEDDRFASLAGRVETLGLLYQQLSVGEGDVDLGSYLSQIASAVMKAQAVEGMRLNHQLDVIPASINVAMPLGLLVNELVTNALKYAFPDREEGGVTLRCVREKDGSCLVSVSDDGVGMPEGESWPKPGKMGFLITRSLEQNAKAKIEATSREGAGVTTMVRFTLP